LQRKSTEITGPRLRAGVNSGTLYANKFQPVAVWLNDPSDGLAPGVSPMSLSLMIWLLAALAYAVFWSWYVGFGHRIRPEEVDGYMHRLASPGVPAEALPIMRRFLETDNGREFVMVNNLKVRRATDSGEHPGDLLAKYQKPYLAAVLRRGGHPLFVGRALADNLEHWGVGDDVRRWSAAGLVRYRSRRDLVECILLPQFHEIHPFKEQAVERTFAYPVAVTMTAGSPRWTVALAAVAVAALAQLALC